MEYPSFCRVQSDDWQKYASIVAAAYTRALLERMPSPNKDPKTSTPPEMPDKNSEGKDYKLSGFFRPSDNKGDEDTLGWRPQVDLNKIRADEPDIDYLGMLPGEKPVTPDDEQRVAWQEQLTIHRRNLNELEKKKAMYTSLNVPIHILHQIDEEKAKIERLENSLKKANWK